MTSMSAGGVASVRPSAQNVRSIGVDGVGCNPPPRLDANPEGCNMAFTS